MLARRIIPCLDVKGGRVVKGVNFVGLRDAGDPVECARRYSDGGADYVLVANSRHPLMKIDASSFGTAEALVPPTEETGVGFEAMSQPGVQRVGERGDAIVMLQSDGGLRLVTVAKSAL